LHHTYGQPASGGVEETVREVAVGLRDLGHRLTILASHLAPSRTSVEDEIDVLRVARLPEAPLRRRGFTGPITHLPLTVRALTTGNFDIAHAFSPADAYASFRWRARTYRPVVFTCTEVLHRSSVADSRLRLQLLSGAVEQADAVTVETDVAHAALSRWMAIQALLVGEPRSDVYAKVYGDLVAAPATRARSGLLPTTPARKGRHMHQPAPESHKQR
jgi:hypothetical protein